MCHYLEFSFRKIVCWRQRSTVLCPQSLHHTYQMGFWYIFSDIYFLRNDLSRVMNKMLKESIYRVQKLPDSFLEKHADILSKKIYLEMPTGDLWGGGGVQKRDRHDSWVGRHDEIVQNQTISCRILRL